MNDENFSIELLRGDDEIYRFMQWRKGDGNLEIISELKDTIGGVQGGTVWVYIAKIGEQWVGSIKLQRFHDDDEMADGRRRGCIGALEVEAEFRRRGIGRALMQRALLKARKRGFTEVTLNVDPTNQAARGLYLAMGFEKFKDSIVYLQGEDVEAESLILQLSAAESEKTGFMPSPESVPIPRRMTVEEYLEFEENSEFKHEFWHGQVVAMAGARRDHNTLAAQISRAFNNRLDDTTCQATTSDLRVAINDNENYAYPDVTVWCEDAQWLEDAFDTLLTPLVIVEILSAGTQSKDRSEKLDAYRNLPSLLDYLIVSPNRVSVEHYARGPQQGLWLNRHHTHRDEKIHFAALNLEIDVAQFYRRLENIPEGLLALTDDGERIER